MFLQDRASESADASGGFKLYHYDPTIPGAVIFMLLFLATTAFHFWQLIRPRCWFMLPLAIVEVVGYAARCKSGTQSPDWTLGPFIMQATLLLVAPALFAATIYMELGRIIAMVDGEGHVKIPLRWLTKIFVIGDVFSFMLQGAGAGLQAGGSLEALDNGSKIVVGGLFVQLICFGVFMVMAVSFDLSIRRAPTVRSLGGAPWKKHMMALYIGSVFIMVRSVFRAIEYIQGFDGYLLSHEPYMYVFDSVLMFLVMALFNWRHPAEIMIYLGRSTPNYKMDPVAVV
ncbi:RTA1 like protein-domain-containing protein [Fusarium solani]|uniref:RTA1 like protein-domain-containing protein n=1 Tax=Fusarium solani TaxID=169388 RepID=A0A9P9K9N4_FUSSL|nr:RTA1 like protein-domain-containing protein [Fusarium solani]KAH7249266.1 RTA1 like protein-domain-containing protein [Fusarium solani]